MAGDGKAEQGIMEELARGVMIVVIVLYTLPGVETCQHSPRRPRVQGEVI